MVEVEEGAGVVNKENAFIFFGQNQGKPEALPLTAFSVSHPNCVTKKIKEVSQLQLQPVPVRPMISEYGNFFLPLNRSPSPPSFKFKPVALSQLRHDRGPVLSQQLVPPRYTKGFPFVSPFSKPGKKSPKSLRLVSLSPSALYLSVPKPYR